MTRKLLLTSFATWKPEQPSNSSDDLLQELLQHKLLLDSCNLLRQLPVDFDLAPEMTIAQCQKLQPDVIVCCGMAETRDRLNLEAQAVKGDRILKTGIDLSSLAADLSITDISYDAGQFVCNALYFSLLEHLQDSSQICLFVHIPVLTPTNRLPIRRDFCQVLDRLVHMPLPASSEILA